MKSPLLPDCSLVPACRAAVLALAVACLLFARPSLADGLSVTTGLGYKPMVQDICAAYAKKTGQVPTEMYSGNIGQILEQAKAGSGVNVIISDEGTLKASDVRFASFEPLGQAVLVLAWRKGVSLAAPEDLKKPEIAKIGYPDGKAAIYGKAAVAFLTGNNLFEALKPKLSMFATVPQVFSYLMSGDLDAAFVNEAMARKQGDSIGGWMEVSKGYTPLLLVAGIVQGQENNPDVRAFRNFLGTPEVRALCAKSGLRAPERP